MKNIFQYQGKVEPVFNGPETPQLDKWHQALSEPKRFAKSLAVAVVLAASGNFFVAPTEAPAETVTVDKYHQQFSTPQSRPNITNRIQGQFVVDPRSLLNPETPQLDKWFNALELPVRAKLNHSIYISPSGFSTKPAVIFPNLDKTIREAILADAQIVALLGTWQSVGSVHTRRPAPSGAGKPIIMISGDISITDEDSLTSEHPVIVKDVICYGDQPLSYRDVEEVGALLRVLFHRKRHLLSLEGWHIIDVTVTGPFIAPTDDDKTCARGVTLTIKLLDLRSA